MTSIAEISSAMQKVLGEKADELGRTSGFIQRERVLSGSSFGQSLVFGWLGNEQASLRELSQVSHEIGAGVSRQNLDQRFTPEAVRFMEMLLGASLEAVIEGNAQTAGLLAPYGKIYVTDSTVITLPDSLQEQWAGIQGSGLKLSVCWDLQRGSLPMLHWHSAREHDTHAPLPLTRLTQGDLWLADLAYFKLDRFEQFNQQGCWWLSRYKTGTHLYQLDGQPFDLAAYLDELTTDTPQELSLHLGASHRLPVRLIVQKITDPDRLARRERKLHHYESKKQTTASSQRRQLCDYDVFITTIPADLATPHHILHLTHVRWQIECLFKLWKNEVHLDEWRSAQPCRILCEIYAKLIALIIQHWLFLLGDVHHLHLSLTQARTIVRHYSWTIARFLFDPEILHVCLLNLIDLFRACCIHSSPKRLATFKRLSP